MFIIKTGWNWNTSTTAWAPFLCLWQLSRGGVMCGAWFSASSSSSFHVSPPALGMLLCVVSLTVVATSVRRSAAAVADGRLSWLNVGRSVVLCCMHADTTLYERRRRRRRWRRFFWVSPDSVISCLVTLGQVERATRSPPASVWRETDRCANFLLAGSASSAFAEAAVLRARRRSFRVCVWYSTLDRDLLVFLRLVVWLIVKPTGD